MLIARGLSNAEIGERLFIGEGTARWHASGIYGAFGLSPRGNGRAGCRLALAARLISAARMLHDC